MSASNFIDPFMTQWEVKHLTRLLIVGLYPRHAYIVIDTNSRLYDYNIAHKQLFPIPVHILRLSRSKSKWKFFRCPTEDRVIALTLAELHWCNGQNPTPFFVDHINGSVYMSPRMDGYEMPYVQSRAFSMELYSHNCGIAPILEFTS